MDLPVWPLRSWSNKCTQNEIQSLIVSHKSFPQNQNRFNKTEAAIFSMKAMLYKLIIIKRHIKSQQDTVRIILILIVYKHGDNKSKKCIQ